MAAAPFYAGCYGRQARITGSQTRQPGPGKPSQQIELAEPGSHLVPTGECQAHHVTRSARSNNGVSARTPRQPASCTCPRRALLRQGPRKVDIVSVAALVGGHRSTKKARVSRVNGRLGGRPCKTEARARRKASGRVPALHLTKSNPYRSKVRRRFHQLLLERALPVGTIGTHASCHLPSVHVSERTRFWRLWASAAWARSTARVIENLTATWQSKYCPHRVRQIRNATRGST